MNTFRVNDDGSIDTFSGGIIACLAWKGIIDPRDPEINLSDEERQLAISATNTEQESAMEFIYTIQHPDGDEICQSPGMTPDQAYDAFVTRFYGNGCCGFDVEVVCPDGTVIEF